ncbi:uncharacterized protein LOC135076973 [Ostrinia nubilalis]|uniref:uncharacterized protein LOC114362953 n=1 Tax=Ostrinia furnacalis TaxID=93504 RepID=UPI00103BBB33|nr:uncharacterized protein LOC114362953 [Ostrinia furnacalis]
MFFATETELPDWVSIYFLKNGDNEYRCNICETVLHTDEKSMQLLEHIKANHKEVHDLHKENPEATVGFRIEFLHLNVLKDDGDPKTEPVIIGEMCEATSEEIAKPITKFDETMDSHLVVMPAAKKKTQRRESETRRKSWVWKYFIRISNIIYRCKICEAVLSIKGCNTNNMNRHVRTKHPTVFQMEMDEKKDKQSDIETSVELETQNIEDLNLERDYAITQDDTPQTPTKTGFNRRSWIWMYFTRLTNTLAQCKLCNRNICHGGNATGNMNRHLKMIHNKTGHDHNWVWKVFDNTDMESYACKICQYRCVRHDDVDRSISTILNHLKLAHGVVSGEQIITSVECED